MKYEEVEKVLGKAVQFVKETMQDDNLTLAYMYVLFGVVVGMDSAITIVGLEETDLSEEQLKQILIDRMETAMN